MSTSFRLPVLKKDDEFYNVVQLLMRQTVIREIHRQKKHGTRVCTANGKCGWDHRSGGYGCPASKRYFMPEEDYVQTAWRLQANEEINMRLVEMKRAGGEVVRGVGPTSDDHYVLIKRVTEAN